MPIVSLEPTIAELNFPAPAPQHAGYGAGRLPLADHEFLRHDGDLRYHLLDIIKSGLVLSRRDVASSPQTCWTSRGSQRKQPLGQDLREIPRSRTMPNARRWLACTRNTCWREAGRGGGFARRHPYGPLLFYPPISADLDSTLPLVCAATRGCLLLTYVADEAGGLLLLAHLMQHLPIRRPRIRAATQLKGPLMHVRATLTLVKWTIPGH